MISRSPSQNRAPNMIVIWRPRFEALFSSPDM